jgi:hypothetical protein
MQSNKREFAGRRVCEGQWGDARERGEPDGDLDEPLTGCRAAPNEQGDEHSADDRSNEGELSERSQWDLAMH